MKKEQTRRRRSNTVHELIAEYDKQTMGFSLGPRCGERALYHLLDRWKDNLPEMTDYFHKAFRQTDVTDDGHTDMAIWCLLQHAPLFWELFEQAQKGRLPIKTQPAQDRAGKE